MISRRGLTRRRQVGLGIGGCALGKEEPLEPGEHLERPDPVQADAVLATAIAHDVDPDQLLRRLAPLLIKPPMSTPQARPIGPAVSDGGGPTTNPIVIDPEQKGRSPSSR